MSTKDTKTSSSSSSFEAKASSFSSNFSEFLTSSLFLPRSLYSSVYAWISVTGGRFFALFLRDLGLSHTDIGLALAIQYVILTVFSSWGGMLADRLEQARPGLGRIQVLCTGIVYSTLVYLLNLLAFQETFSYILLSSFYSVGLALVFPVLDGITLDYLERSSCKKDFGGERVYGALSWAMTNLYMSLALDLYGFACTYSMAAFGAITALGSIFIYTTNWGNPNKPPSQSQSRLHDTTTSNDGAGLDKVKKTTNNSSEDRDDSEVSDTSTDFTGTTAPESDIDNSWRTESDMDNSSRADRDASSNPDTEMPIPDHDSDASSTTTSLLKSLDDHDSSEVSSLGASSTDYDHDSQSRCHIDDFHELKNRNMVEICSPRIDDRSAVQSRARKGETLQKMAIDDSEQKVYRDIMRALFSSCYGSAFIFLYTLLSAGQSIVDNLIFLYYKELGSSFVLMGYAVVITTAFELPVYYASPALLKSIGAQTLLLVGGLAYVIRVLGYTMISPNQVWVILLLEPLHGLTHAGTLAAVTHFVAHAVPKGYEATGQEVVYFIRGAGMSTGVFMGAWVQDMFGAPFMYRGSALIVAVGLLSFILALVLDGLFLIKAPHISNEKRLGSRKKHGDLEAGKPEQETAGRRTLAEQLEYL